jgi:hypothetical protein
MYPIEKRDTGVIHLVEDGVIFSGYSNPDRALDLLRDVEGIECGSGLGGSW